MIEYIHMFGPWFDFTVVILVQLVVFIIHAWYEKRLKEVPKILGLGMVIGIVFGIMFDLIIGKYVGLYSYVLGFNATFLIPNGILSYGFMQANVLLMQRVQLVHFYIWTVIVAVVYEITNYYFQVWTWEFSSTKVELLIVHSVLYVGLALLMAGIWHFLFNYKFNFIDKAFKKSLI